MILQIETQVVKEGEVVDDDIFAIVESDMLPPIGAKMHLSGRGIFIVAEHFWSIDDEGFDQEATIKVHVAVRQAR